MVYSWRFSGPHNCRSLLWLPSWASSSLLLRPRLAQELIKEQSKFQQTSKPVKEAEVCSKIGKHYIRNGQFQEAIEVLKNEMKLWIQQKDWMGEAMCHRSLGECYVELEDYPRALLHHDKYMAWAESTNSYVELQRALATLGRTFICKAASMDEKNSQEAKTSIAKSEQLLLRSMSVCDNHLTGVVPESELQQMKGRFFLNRGLVYMHQGSFKESVEYTEKAIKIAEETNELEDLYRSHLSLADVYLLMNKALQSIHALNEAYFLSKQLNDKKGESYVLIKKAHVHLRLGEFSAAAGVLRTACMIESIKPTERQKVVNHYKIAKKCCKLQTELKNAKEESNLTKMMEIHEKLGDKCCKVKIYREALLHYNEQLKCAQTLKIPDEKLIKIYVSLAATYADDHQYEKAITMYYKELQLIKGNSKELSLQKWKTFLNIADAQEKAGKEYKSIYASYSQANKLAVKNRNPILRLRVLQSLAVVQENFGKMSELQVTKGDLDLLKSKYDLESDDDKIIDKEDENHQEAESTDDSEEEDLINIGVKNSLEESWKVPNKKGKTRISRKPGGKSKKRSISELDPGGVIGLNKKHSSQVARTTEGTPISPDDIVSEILNDNEEPIPIQTSQEQQHSHLPAEPELERPANPSASPQDGPPKAISSTILEQCQRSLQQLCLCKSYIDDDTMHELARNIASLSQVSAIDLSHNKITYKGLQAFCEVLFRKSDEVQGSLPLQHLTKLVLSNNPLRDKCAHSIANIISHCPQLNKLSLSSTQLTGQFEMEDRIVMKTALGGAAKLQMLDVSQNALGSAGVELLLQFLNPEKITSLVLSSVNSGSDDGQLSKHIAWYCSQPDFALCSLALEDCGLNDTDMRTLSKCLPVSKVWCYLNLSSNPLITNQGLFILLQGLILSGCQLQSLDVSLCGLEPPLKMDLISSIVKTMTKIDQSQGHLSSLKLSSTFSHSDLLKSIWQLAHGKSAQHQIDGPMCTFSIKQG